MSDFLFSSHNNADTASSNLATLRPQCRSRAGWSGGGLVTEEAISMVPGRRRSGWLKKSKRSQADEFWTEQTFGLILSTVNPCVGQRVSSQTADPRFNPLLAGPNRQYYMCSAFACTTLKFACLSKMTMIPPNPVEISE